MSLTSLCWSRLHRLSTQDTESAYYRIPGLFHSLPDAPLKDGGGRAAAHGESNGNGSEMNDAFATTGDSFASREEHSYGNRLTMFRDSNGKVGREGNRETALRDLNDAFGIAGNQLPVLDDNTEFGGDRPMLVELFDEFGFAGRHGAGSAQRDGNHAQSLKDCRTFYLTTNIHTLRLINVTNLLIKELNTTHFPSLVDLTLSNSAYLTDGGLGMIKEEFELRSFAIENCPKITLRGVFDAMPRNMTRLRIVDISNAEAFKGDIFVDRLQYCESLEVRGCRALLDILVQEIEQSAKNLPRLKTFKTSITPLDLFNHNRLAFAISHSLTLTSVCLSFTSLTREGLYSLAMIKSLKSADVSFSRISFTGSTGNENVDLFSSFVNLRDLNFSGLDFGEEDQNHVFDSMIAFPCLEILNLQDASIKQKFQHSALRQLRIKTLILGGNNRVNAPFLFNATIDDEAQAGISLERLSLSKCELLFDRFQLQDGFRYGFCNLTHLCLDHVRTTDAWPTLHFCTWLFSEMAGDPIGTNMFPLLSHLSAQACDFITTIGIQFVTQLVLRKTLRVVDFSDCGKCDYSTMKSFATAAPWLKVLYDYVEVQSFREERSIDASAIADENEGDEDDGDYELDLAAMQSFIISVDTLTGLLSESSCEDETTPAELQALAQVKRFNRLRVLKEYGCHCKVCAEADADVMMDKIRYSREELRGLRPVPVPKKSARQ